MPLLSPSLNNPPRQRRHFFYLSGCALPDCHLTYHVSTNSLTLFIPPLDPSSVIWSGLPLSPVQALKIYDIDSCLTTDALTSHLQSPPEGEHAILAHTGRGTMDPASTGFKHVTTKDLHSALDNCRITKDDYEVALLRHANHVSTAAHVAVLRSLPKVKNECELEAVFRARCLAMGAKEQAYHGIFGSGENAATLHYQANDQPLEGRQNLLVDAAAEWECYCADVTRTMPLSSKGFSKESEGIYKIVERMQDASFGMLKAGVQWEDVHLRAHEVAIDGLLGLGILKGEKKGLLERRTSVAFFPHGLGHYLGMDTHDTGGNPNHEDQDTMFKYLRVRGRLPEGSVVTVEPGLYFSEPHPPSVYERMGVEMSCGVLLRTRLTSHPFA